MPASQRRSASRPRRSRWRRAAGWGALLAVAAGLGWLAYGSFATRGGPPLDDIDASSRRQLESLLREERAGTRSP